ncbi:MAG TPA: flagellar basal-body rod protein FlgG [Firmicutes bacterium]|uniref:Flagellar basal-body rod protein FlgG n=1 Tax=Capillibacterium thermochitinicola TaxID=2699427 RepID=A0A8J6LIH5_9FIRM|nr:flagellar basal-body rod protein FlgG [Capillibacterium thermochitinicola]MBA2133010.1 flagellar basal-body rod protein FlgG [Capillibacterium thermochitinicola]HHW13017.1 flagellar basal-body rod protein FlgG [Bacillota bacterium]
MIRALWTASSGMIAQQTNIDIISNNLANVNTVGYKKSRAQFQDLLYQTIRAAGSTTAQGSMNPTGLQVGHGVRLISTSKSYEQGDVMQTGNALDLMIEGDGFFQLLLPDGTIGYTRDGNFKIDGEGRIVNNDGYILQPELWIPENATDVIVGSDGTVSVILAGEEMPQEIGQIELARFLNPEGLINIGRNIVRPSLASGEIQYGTAGMEGFGTIAQGYLEMSNVKVVEEMVNLIVAQRAYEVNSKAIQAADEMLQTANNLRR